MDLRDLMPALGGKHYFNYGGQGPLPTPSLEAMVACWGELQRLGPFSRDVWPFLEAQVGAPRRRLAALCSVPPHRLALTENVTTGCVLPLWGLPFDRGDRLLLMAVVGRGACRTSLNVGAGGRKKEERSRGIKSYNPHFRFGKKLKKQKIK